RGASCEGDRAGEDGAFAAPEPGVSRENSPEIAGEAGARAGAGTRARTTAAPPGSAVSGGGVGGGAGRVGAEVGGRAAGARAVISALLDGAGPIGPSPGRADAIAEPQAREQTELCRARITCGSRSGPRPHRRW